MLAGFRSRWSEVNGEYFEVPPGCDSGGMLIDFLRENRLASVVLSGPPLDGGLADALKEKVKVLADFGRETLDRETAVRLCGEADAGITGVDALIAETGTVVAASRLRGDRLCSLLPPVHIAVVGKAPLFENMERFFRALDGDGTLCLITGPSRTADIEKRIVLGAHGPARVVLWVTGINWFLAESCG